MTPDQKAALIRAYRAASRIADKATTAARLALDDVLLSDTIQWSPEERAAVSQRINRLLDAQRQADATCAALDAQLRRGDARVCDFDTWANDGTPAWRWLLATIEAEAPQRALL